MNIKSGHFSVNTTLYTSITHIVLNNRKKQRKNVFLLRTWATCPSEENQDLYPGRLNWWKYKKQDRQVDSSFTVDRCNKYITLTVSIFQSQRTTRLCTLREHEGSCFFVPIHDNVEILFLLSWKLYWFFFCIQHCIFTFFTLFPPSWTLDSFA